MNDVNVEKKIKQTRIWTQPRRDLDLVGGGFLVECSAGWPLHFLARLSHSLFYLLLPLCRG